MNEIKKETAVVFVNQLELIKTLPKNQQLEFLYALFDYEIYGIEPKSSLFAKNKIMEAIWLMAKPLIDKRVKRTEISRENGRKGGAPLGNQNAKKSKTTKKQPKNNQETTKNKLYKYKKKDKDKDKYYPSSSEPHLDGVSESKVLEEDNYYDDDYDLAEWEVDEDGNWLWTKEEEGDA